MVHTDFYAKIQAIKEQELIELKKAIKAHGGSYKWDEDDSRPIIAVNINSCCPNPQDVKITKVAVTNGTLEICGEDKEYGNPVDFYAHDVFAGHLSYIIDAIPPTREITDVSMFPENKPYIPRIGDNVWIFNIDRRYQKNDCSGKVIRIGKKYVHVRVGNYRDIRFDIATLSHNDANYSSMYCLYPSQQICQYEQETQKRRQALTNLFQFLTNQEINELYENLSTRKKQYKTRHSGERDYGSGISI